MSETTKTSLGNYVLQRVLGDGAEGRVYQAVCAVKTRTGVAIGEEVAIKRLYKKAGQDKEPQLFKRQVDILSKLDHPNIVRYRDSFVWHETELEEDLHCLVMELLDGEPLKALLEKNPRGLSWEKARKILEPILDALRHASERGVIHRDLKPSNIHITSHGDPKLVDFGIARHDEGDADATSSTAGAKGTYDYMAPDFAKDGKFRGDEQSDIFSFGVIIHQTLTGVLPFPPLGEDANRGYFLRWLGPTQPAADLRSPIFRVLNQASACVNQCLNPDRAQRFKTFSEVIAAFEQIGYRKLKHGTTTYEFTEWLGKGGFGEVFKARRVRDQRAVAIKRLFGADHSARFVREAKILREAAHPNLTEYLDFVEAKVRDDEKEYYLILEYLEGMPGAGLRERIRGSVTGLEPVETLQIFARYLDCLDHLHRNGIIHRDLKPGNLYAPAGQPQRAKIFDLGIAHDDDGTKTRGQIPGTLDYMPPEFASQNSERGSAQSDLYSLGVTLYQTLTRKLPLTRLPKSEADAWVEFFRRAQTPSPLSFEHPVFQARPELVPLLQRSLAHDAPARFSSAAAMRDEINGVLIRWELKAAGRNPDQGTEATLFVKSTAVTLPAGVVAPVAPLPTLEAELQKVIEEIPAPVTPEPAAEPPQVVAEAASAQSSVVVEPAPEPPAETQIPAVVEPDPVELENARVAAEEAQLRAKVAELERLARLTKLTEEHTVETAARRKLMEAKWEVEEKKRKADELAAQELQLKVEAEEAEKQRLAQERRTKDIAEIKSMLRQKAAEIRAMCVRFTLAVKTRFQKVRFWMAAKWLALGGFRGLAVKVKTSVATGIAWLRKKTHAASASPAAKNFGQKLRRAKEKLIAGTLVLWHGLQKPTALAVQNWRRQSKKNRLIISVAVIAVLILIGILAVGGIKSHLRTVTYDRTVVQAKVDYQRGDFAAAGNAATAALAIRGDDPAIQQLARDSQEQYKLHANFESLLKSAQTALGHHDYTNALLIADQALQQIPGDRRAASIRDDAQKPLADYHAAVGAAFSAYQNADYLAAGTNADMALAIYPDDLAMQQLKSDAQEQLDKLKAYQKQAIEAVANNIWHLPVNIPPAKDTNSPRQSP